MDADHEESDDPARTLAAQLTALKSQLRLQSDGVYNRTELLATLARTKRLISSYQVLVLACDSDNDDDDGEETDLGGDSLPPATRRRHSSSSSTHSSWRSSTSTVSTAATTVSRDFPEKLPSPDHEFGGGLPEEASDPAFDRLSTLLFSLQQEAEAAVSSPVPTPDASLLRRRSSEPSTPCPVQRRSMTLALPPPSVTLEPPVLRRSITTPSTPRRLSEPIPLSRASTVNAGGSEMEKLLSLLDDGLFLRQHEGMFRFVWIYILAGAIVWAAVGTVLGWGCNQRCVAA